MRKLLLAFAGGAAVVVLAVSPALGGGGSDRRPTELTAASEPSAPAAESSTADSSTAAEDETRPKADTTDTADTTKAPADDPARKRPSPEFERMRLACDSGHRDDQAFVACKWSPSHHPRFAGYVLRRGDGDTRTVVFRTRDREQTNYLDRDVVRGQTYLYRIEAVAEDGTVIGHSEPVKVTVGRPPTRELRLACELMRSDKGPAVGCKWSAIDNAAGYRLIRTDRETRVTVCRVEAGGGTGCVDREVSRGATYAYVVEAVGRDGEVVARGGPVKVVIPA